MWVDPGRIFRLFSQSQDKSSHFQAQVHSKAAFSRSIQATRGEESIPIKVIQPFYWLLTEFWQGQSTLWLELSQAKTTEILIKEISQSPGVDEFFFQTDQGSSTSEDCFYGVNPLQCGRGEIKREGQPTFDVTELK